MRVDEHLSVDMTSYDRYLQEYVRAPPPPSSSFYHHHHHCQQLDETGGRAAVWGTAGGLETLSADQGPSRHGGLQPPASTPTAVDGSDDVGSRRPPPAFSIDAILSDARTTTTGSGITAELTSAAGGEWSRAQSLVASRQTSGGGGENTTKGSTMECRVCWQST